MRRPRTPLQKTQVGTGLGLPDEAVVHIVGVDVPTSHLPPKHCLRKTVDFHHSPKSKRCTLVACWGERPNAPRSTSSSPEAAAGKASCLVLDGEPGVGKPSCWLTPASVASGFASSRRRASKSRTQSWALPGWVELVALSSTCWRRCHKDKWRRSEGRPGTGASSRPAGSLSPPGYRRSHLPLSAARSSPGRRPPVGQRALPAQALLFAAHRLRAKQVAVAVSLRAVSTFPYKPGTSTRYPQRPRPQAASELLLERAGPGRLGCRPAPLINSR